MTPKTTPARRTTRPNVDRVWIELDKPDNDAHAMAICDLANVMLRRLNDGASPSQHFEWNDERQMYEFGNEMGFEGLPDRGRWFSLTFMGRPMR